MSSRKCLPSTIFVSSPFLIVFMLCVLYVTFPKSALVRAQTSSSKTLQQTNLLFIMFDDLRPELSVYGRDYMITPNFERLAQQSVVFDHAYVQIAVCNPSRDSLLTGLRPDTVGTYGFQSSFRPFRVFPTELVRSGYNTASIGKIAHWEGPDNSIWNFLQWDNDWYGYQGREPQIMNSSTMPDKIKPEHEFRDHLFASKTIDCLQRMLESKKYFMLSVGFKLPHLAVHVPYRYYEMYKNMLHQSQGRNSNGPGGHHQRSSSSNMWKLTRKELKFPMSSPDVAYRCCANPDFEFMNQEGALRWDTKLTLGDINFAFTERMRDELMLGYAAGVTYVDYQLGRLLDAVDAVPGLWNNITIILTSDHGMHNGEKGMWEKWTLFDESVRVPLIMYHPQSPYRGQHFKSPVELIDVYPTVKDLVGVNFNHPDNACQRDSVCKPLQGKSLAHIVLGNDMVPHASNGHKKSGSNNGNNGGGDKTRQQDHQRRNTDTSGNKSNNKQLNKQRVGVTLQQNSSTPLKGPQKIVPSGKGSGKGMQKPPPKQFQQQLQQQDNVQSQTISKLETTSSVATEAKGVSTTTTTKFGTSSAKSKPAGPSTIFDSIARGIVSLFTSEKAPTKEVDSHRRLRVLAAKNAESVTKAAMPVSSKTSNAEINKNISRRFVGNKLQGRPTSSSSPAPPRSQQQHRQLPQHIGTVINGVQQIPMENDTDTSYFAISQSWRCAIMEKVRKATAINTAIRNYIHNSSRHRLDTTAQEELRYRFPQFQPYYDAAANPKHNNITLLRADAQWFTCDIKPPAPPPTPNPTPSPTTTELTSAQQGKVPVRAQAQPIGSVADSGTVEVSVMGYSMRTMEYRYTAWFNYNRQTCTPIVDSVPLFEEFYDHRGERLEDFTHLETRNLLNVLPKHKADTLAQSMRKKLVAIIKEKFVFRGCFKP